ncbi:MAG: ABC transporter permease [Armatimonadota bacterium]|nr:ABC transporter permease [Armatimonadota bacterium]
MKRFLHRSLSVKELPVALLLCGVCAYFSASEPRFADLNGLMDVARQYSTHALLAVSLTLIIASGGIDISVGSVVGLCAVVLASLLSRTNVGISTACALSLAVGTFCGLCNGAAIARLGLQPVVVTLSMMATARGLAYVIAGPGVSTISLPSRAHLLVTIGYESNVPVLIALIWAAAAYAVLSQSSFGRYVLAIGGNEQAARLSGIDVSRTKIIVYCAAGAVAGLGGILTAAMMSTATTDAGLGYEFEAITAVLMGGTSIFGGEATVLGSLLGVATAAALNRGFGLMGINDLWRMMCLGLILIGAVAMETSRRRVLTSLGSHFGTP